MHLSKHKHRAYDEQCATDDNDSFASLRRRPPPERDAFVLVNALARTIHSHDCAMLRLPMENDDSSEAGEQSNVTSKKVPTRTNDHLMNIFYPKFHAE
ncbi:hypothetical protein Tcan_14987 [Toxocara canis]|uniref:Uncharacterized protein n=1 Tax=Toxocara canis TaxID=6265 RepID=A0A0B2VWC6_TOXCA|nr:hypothetical protein Tcan_14987 [Toxocara canis]